MSKPRRARLPPILDSDFESIPQAPPDLEEQERAEPDECATVVFDMKPMDEEEIKAEEEEDPLISVILGLDSYSDDN